MIAAGSEYIEIKAQLALGVEPLDALDLLRIYPALQVRYNAGAIGLPRPTFLRHSTSIHALMFGKGVSSPVEVRLFEKRQRYVPRRIEYPILALAAAEGRPATERIRRPRMFPAANYPVDSGATGLRGRVLRNDVPVRWARVEAGPAGGNLIARAHGDEFGEFLLILPPHTALAALGNWDLEVTAFARSGPVPAPPSPDIPALDPWWDLPLEKAPAPGSADTVSAGVDLPPTYTAKTTKTVGFVPGRIISQVTFAIV